MKGAKVVYFVKTIDYDLLKGMIRASTINCKTGNTKVIQRQKREVLVNQDDIVTDFNLPEHRPKLM